MYINTFNGNTCSYKQERNSEKWLSEAGRGLETDARVRRSLIHLPTLISYSPSAPRPFPQSSDLPNVKHNKQPAAHQASNHHQSPDKPSLLIHVSAYSSRKHSEPTLTRTRAQSQSYWTLLVFPFQGLPALRSIQCLQKELVSYKHNSTPCISGFCSASATSGYTCDPGSLCSQNPFH